MQREFIAKFEWTISCHANGATECVGSVQLQKVTDTVSIGAIEDDDSRSRNHTVNNVIGIRSRRPKIILNRQRSSVYIDRSLKLSIAIIIRIRRQPAASVEGDVCRDRAGVIAVVIHPELGTIIYRDGIQGHVVVFDVGTSGIDDERSVRTVDGATKRERIPSDLGQSEGAEIDRSPNIQPC